MSRPMIDLLRLALLWSVCAPAQAYIDPNVGSQLYQAIYPVLALILGVFAFARQWVSAFMSQIADRVRKSLARIFGADK